MKKKTAFAHIDNRFCVPKVIKILLEKLEYSNTSHEEKPRVWLLGGDFGMTLVGSHTLYNAIKKELDQRKISFTHQNYSFTVQPTISTLFYFGLRLFEYVGPESYMGFMFCCAILYALNFLVNQKLQHSLDVCFDVKNSSITVVKDDFGNSARIFKQAPPTQLEAFKKRCELNPWLPESEQLSDVSSVSL